MGGNEIVILSQFEEIDFLQQQAEALILPENADVVIADDYLDPRLTPINRAHCPHFQPIVGIRPSDAGRFLRARRFL